MPRAVRGASCRGVRSHGLRPLLGRAQVAPSSRHSRIQPRSSLCAAVTFREVAGAWRSFAPQGNDGVRLLGVSAHGTLPASEDVEPRFLGASAHGHRAACECRGRVHGEAAADATWLPPATSPRHTDVCLPREGRRGSLSPGGAPAEAQTSDRGGRVRAVRWSVCTAGDPDQHGRTSPGSGCDVCGGQSDPVSAPPGSGLHTGSSQRESSRVQSASVLPVSGVRAGGEHPCAPGERARLSVSAPARGFLTARKRPPWAVLGPEETRLEAPVF